MRVSVQQFLSVLIVSVMAIILVYAFRAKINLKGADKIVLSNFTFVGENGQDSTGIDSTKHTIMIWFHPACEGCCYQLDVINNNLFRFDHVRFLFITDEKNFFINKDDKKWPRLVESLYARFGIVEQMEFVEKFGPVMTPTLFVFNHAEVLVEKFYGEVKIEKIITLINRHTVPEQKMSGFK